MWNKELTSKPKEQGKDCHIAPTAQFSENVILGDRVQVGPNVVILEGTTIGSDTFVAPNCVIGEPPTPYYRAEKGRYVPETTVIGSGSILRSGTSIYSGAQIGRDFQSGNNVCIREGVRIGDFCGVGSNSDIQFEACIGDYTRMHSFVHITEKASIGKYVWIMPRCTFTSDHVMPLNVPLHPVVGDFCVLGANCFFYPGAELGTHVIVGAGSQVKGSHDDYSFIEGSPAKMICDSRKYFTQVDGKLMRPYPWLKHVSLNYPWKDVPPTERELEDYL